MKLVFMGTPDFAVPTLKTLYGSRHEILLVVTQPDRPKGRGREVQPPPVKIFAEAQGIPVFQPLKVKTPDSIEKLKALEPDAFIVVAFGQILSQDVLDIPKHCCINLHSSILPKYRGAAPINWAVINGDKETGVTTMLMDKGMDTGDILHIDRIPIAPEDTTQTLHDTLAQRGAELMLKTVDELEAGQLKPVKQDDAQATMAPKLTKDLGLIHWDKSAEEIVNLIRGTAPWPGAFTWYQDKRLRVIRATVENGYAEDTCGEVMAVSDAGIDVGTGAGRIRITELQLEGRKPMPVKSFLQGIRVARGDRLGAPGDRDSSVNDGLPMRERSGPDVSR